MGTRGTLTSNLSTVDEPVTSLPIALVTTNSGGVDHRDRIVSIEGNGRVNGCQREVRSGRNFCITIQPWANGGLALKTLTIFRDELTRSDCSKTLEVSREDCRRFERWDGDRDELCVFEMSLDAFQLELRGLRESDREESAGDEEGAESHWERKWASGSE